MHFHQLAVGRFPIALGHHQRAFDTIRTHVLAHQVFRSAGSQRVQTRLQAGHQLRDLIHLVVRHRFLDLHQTPDIQQLIDARERRSGIDHLLAQLVQLHKESQQRQLLGRDAIGIDAGAARSVAENLP